MTRSSACCSCNAPAAIYNYTLTLAAELQGVQQPGGPTDRHRADQCRLQLVCLYQRCGAGEQQACVVESKRMKSCEYLSPMKLNAATADAAQCGLRAAQSKQYFQQFYCALSKYGTMGVDVRF